MEVSRSEYTGPAPRAWGMGDPDAKPDFWVHQGPPQQPHVHVAVRAETGTPMVDAFYVAARAAGGRDNGPPRPRPHYHRTTRRRAGRSTAT